MKKVGLVLASFVVLGVVAFSSEVSTHVEETENKKL